MNQESKKTSRVPLKQQVVDLKVELEKQQDKSLRLLAEFDNYRKRMEKDVFELALKEKKQLLQKFLDIYETFSMMYNDNKTEGLLLILNQFKRVLNDEGIEQMQTLGKPFDYQYHHVIATRSGTEPEGTIIEEVKKGYLLNGEVFRPAYVIVTKEGEK